MRLSTNIAACSSSPERSPDVGAERIRPHGLQEISHTSLLTVESAASLNSPKSTTRIDALTILRFLAAMVVVNFHFGKELYDWPRILIAGPEMVAFFFVLSGFVMSYSYLPRVEQFSARKYWWGRFKRLAPAYYLALAAVAWRGNFDQTSLILSVLNLQSWVPPYALNLNAPAWSLSVEMFFYLTFPAIIYGIRRFQCSTVLVCIAGCALWMGSETILLSLVNSTLNVEPPSTYYYLCFFSPFAYWASFCLGVAGGTWFLSRSTRDSTGWSFVAVLTAVAICYTVNRQVDLKSALGWSHLDSNVLSPLYLLLIISLAQAKSSVNDWLSAKPFVALGEGSYYMYIFQLPLWFACRDLFLSKVESPGTFMLIYLTILIVSSLLLSRFVGFHLSRTTIGRRSKSALVKQPV